MAIVKNMNSGEPPRLGPWLAGNRQLEKEDKTAAIQAYKKMLQYYPLNETVYDRLMILFRQMKMPAEELTAITKAISIFEKKFNTKNVRSSAKVTALSKSLIRSMGLVDKKGKSYYLPQPIARWTKRKEGLQKKMQ